MLEGSASAATGIIADGREPELRCVCKVFGGCSWFGFRAIYGFGYRVGPAPAGFRGTLFRGSQSRSGVPGVPGCSKVEKSGQKRLLVCLPPDVWNLAVLSGYF